MITSSASARSFAWSSAGIDAGIFTNGRQKLVACALFAFATSFSPWSRPSSVTRGGVNPRAIPARMFAICSSKYSGTSFSRSR